MEIRFTYLNTLADRRTSDAQQVIACVALQAPAAHWILTAPIALEGLEKLYRVAGVDYYGRA